MKAVYFLIAISIVMIFFMVELFSPFIKAISISILLVVATNSLTSYFQNRLKSRIFASTVMTFMLSGLFFIPILYCIFSFINFFNQVEQESLIQTLNEMKIYLLNFSTKLIFLSDLLNDITSKIDVSKTVQDMFSIGAYLGKNSAKFMIDIVMILIFFFFFTLY